ncbi:DNA-binding transcriptional LysR family regulator [Bradyrhizobium daqingense]
MPKLTKPGKRSRQTATSAVAFRITAPLTLGSTHFAPVLASLAQRHPQLHIQASFTDQFVDLIAEGLDCAIRVGHLANSNLLARRVGWISAKYVASPNYILKHGSPATPEEFVTHEVAMQGTKTWLAMDGDKIVTLKPQGRFVADNAVALVSAALAGIGLAGVPEALIKEHLASGALVPVMTQYPSPDLGIYVIRPPGQYPARKVRVLTEMLIECFGRPSRVD